MAPAYRSRLDAFLESYMLRSGEECVGILADVQDKDGHIISIRLEGPDWVRTILLPVSIKPKLERLKGKVTGILQIDGDYFVREVREA